MLPVLHENAPGAVTVIAVDLVENERAHHQPGPATPSAQDAAYPRVTGAHDYRVRISRDVGHTTRRADHVWRDGAIGRRLQEAERSLVIGRYGRRRVLERNPHRGRVRAAVLLPAVLARVIRIVAAESVHAGSRQLDRFSLFGSGGSCAPCIRVKRLVARVRALPAFLAGLTNVTGQASLGPRSDLVRGTAPLDLRRTREACPGTGAVDPALPTLVVCSRSALS